MCILHLLTITRIRLSWKVPFLNSFLFDLPNLSIIDHTAMIGNNHNSAFTFGTAPNKGFGNNRYDSSGFGYNNGFGTNNNNNSTVTFGNQQSNSSNSNNFEHE